MRRRWWIALLVAVAAASTALLYARSQTPIFRSAIRLEVSARFDNGQQLALERLLPQLAQRVKTTELARQVDTRLRLDVGEEQLLSRLRVEPIVQSAQILLEVDDVSPERAQAIASEAARVFEEQHAARNQGIPSQDRAIVSTLDRPSPPRLVWPQTRAIVGAALLLGLAAGVALAFLVDVLDDTVKTTEDIERSLGLTTLARIPPGSGLLFNGSQRPSRDVMVAGVQERGA